MDRYVSTIFCIISLDGIRENKFNRWTDAECLRHDSDSDVQLHRAELKIK